MERYQVILAYDGTQFLGFQRQGKGRTVQGVFEVALRRLGWQGRTILAAGRTDAGVHAAGQVIAFDLEWDHPVAALQRALNAALPQDIAVRVVRRTRSDFHPCYDAASRQYRYRLYCQPARDPLRDRYAWRVWPAPRIEFLQQAASYLPGLHDFAAFGTPPRTHGTTVRTVFRADWQSLDDELHFEISANAFLYHMVRRLVYLQVRVGQGRLEHEIIPQSLQLAGKGPSVRGLAPARGLSLMEVDFADDMQRWATVSLRANGEREMNLESE